jgi:hypothetical protein
MKENPIRSASGIPMLLVLLAGLLFGAYLMYTGANTASVTWLVLGLADHHRRLRLPVRPVSWSNPTRPRW